MAEGNNISNNDGRARVVIEGVTPEVDGGAFPVKRCVGDRLRVEADAFVDGHDLVACSVWHRPPGAGSWLEVPARALRNDRFRAEIDLPELGEHRYTVEAWVDRFATFRRDFEKRALAGQDLAMDAEIGARLIDEAAERAEGAEAIELRQAASALRDPEASAERRVDGVMDERLGDQMRRLAPRRFVTRLGRELVAVVDPLFARFGAWYELFPRSWSPLPGEHGTLRDVQARLPEIAAMGFDVLYLPPVHPIGRDHRKGRNNAVTAAPGDVGSPWAIGAVEGGHRSVHPELGTVDDLRSLALRARELGIELALDIAFQCAPDHPYVREHPRWFRARPDGSIQYAENPPKKYQDIFPFDFESDGWRDLWAELLSVVMFWVEQGVRIFRVDNPHTKPFGFWQWLIGEAKRQRPDLVFLAEAFTRPKPLYRLAKLGFSQSYNYFPWRNGKLELTEYLTEITTPPISDFCRPALWPNTPDILTEYLQTGGRAAFMVRLVLASMMGATYGVYGPAFELCEAEPREAGSEEYRDSEKYEIRSWDTGRAAPFRALMARLNQLRRESLALQSNESLRFHPVDNEQVICFSKHSPGGEAIVVVANLDPHHRHTGWVELDLDALGLPADQPFQAHDVITDARFLWRGARNYVELDPREVPAHVFRVRRRVRTERDFEYFL